MDSPGTLAAHLKGERLARGWSIGELAEASGVSRAMISKIERDEVSPTAALLSRLANAFGLTLSALFARAEQRHTRLSRAGERKSWTDPESGYTRWPVLALEHFPLEIVEVELPPDTQASFPAASYALRHHAVWVREGQLRIEEGEQANLLEAGDCLALGAASAVRFSNPATGPCRYAVFIGRM